MVETVMDRVGAALNMAEEKVDSYGETSYDLEEVSEALHEATVAVETHLILNRESLKSREYSKWFETILDKANGKLELYKGPETVAANTELYKERRNPPFSSGFLD